MSAIEMMDPKMDAGMMCNQAKRPVHNLQQSVQVGISVYSVLVSVSCPKALFHLESDNLFRITVVVADWLG